MKRNRRYLLYDLLHACVLAGGLIVLLTACRTAQPSDLSPRISDRTETVEAQPAGGFLWPYLLYTPDQLHPEPRPILVLSLNSPQPHDNYQHHWNHAVGKVDQYRPIADELGAEMREDVVHFIDSAVERGTRTAASPAPPLGRKGVFQ